MTPQEARDLLAQGDRQAVLPRIEEVLNARVGEAGGHLEWGDVLDEAGLPALAFREWLLAVRDGPGEPRALSALARAYRERGESEKAAPLLERYLRARPDDPEAVQALVEVYAETALGSRALEVLDRAEASGVSHDLLTELRAWIADLNGGPADEQPPAARVPGDEEVVRFLDLFSGREGVHARQWQGDGGRGGYSPVREPLTPAVLRNHLLGNETVGVYPLRADGTVVFFALDLDITRAALKAAGGLPEEMARLRQTVAGEGLRLRGELEELGLPCLLEDSGYKGRHLWVLLETPESAKVVRNFGRLFLAREWSCLPDGLGLEFFPKQDRLGEGQLGNLLKLPLGLHRKTGLRCSLLDDEGAPVADPLASLASARRVARDTLHAAIRRLRDEVGEGAVAPMDEPGEEGRIAEEGVSEEEVEDYDLDSDPEVRCLLEHCSVLRALREHVETEYRLSWDQQVVIRHTLGHLRRGAAAVNAVLRRAVDVGPNAFLASRLSGNPISCPRIRQRIPEVTERVDCRCAFPLAPDRYPTPVLHLLGMDVESGSPETDPGLEAEARTLAGVLDELDAVSRRAELARAGLADRLRRQGRRRIETDAGILELKAGKDGREELVWTPRGSAGHTEGEG